MILSLVNAFDATKQYNSLYTFNTRNKGIGSARLTVQTSAPHELVLEFTPETPPSVYHLIKELDYGIRLQRDGFDLLFIPDLGSKKINSRGYIYCRYFSAVYTLKYQSLRNLFVYRPRTNSNAILGAIGDKDWVTISPSFQTPFDYGAKSGIDNLNELLKLGKGWSYLDVGLVDNNGTLENRILVGDFDDLPWYAAQDSKFDIETIGNTTNFVNPFDKKPLIEDIDVSYGGKQIKYLFVALDTGSGVSARNASPVFTNSRYAFIDQDYPLVRINGVFYIQDTKYNNTEERFGTYFVTLSSDVDNGEQKIFTVLEALEYAYKKAITYLKEEAVADTYNVTLTHRKLTLPKFYRLKYNKTIKSIHGKSVNTIDVDQKILLDRISYDLTKL